MKYLQNANIVLASASPRRAELLTSVGLKFEVSPADIDENIGVKRPKKLVEELARRKAEAIEADGSCVIGGDTVVYARGKLYGKPHTAERAEQTLKELSGRWHTVYSGVAIVYNGKTRAFHVASRVKFRRMSDAEIAEYVKDKSPLDKAGAYGIQDGEVVAKYRGSYSNIVGLPLEKTIKIMQRMGIIYGNDRSVD